MMSAIFAERITVVCADELGKGVINIVDARLKPGELVDIEIHAVAVGTTTGRLLDATRKLALDLPEDFSTSFETKV